MTSLLSQRRIWALVMEAENKATIAAVTRATPLAGGIQERRNMAGSVPGEEKK
jgi:hypothetical protein